ncbi:hypothetical protein QQ008_10260 [Fulvivirgaceae bacterium BMA10]|uniref:Response regulatory domain-containing protein n=1 Tax=Splendidivirga corallicola TaxID=3051826 RepID=A0ABT8KNE4_9BACT|nr:hypothetical protein [Fulvivirgaceae bacterium BMA10]
MSTSTENVETNSAEESLNVLLVGNNPIEMTKLYGYLSAIKGKKIIAEYCFSARDSLIKALKLKPACILIDDSIDNLSIKRLMEGIGRHVKTRDIPLTLLKSSNKRQVSDYGFSDFLMKENLSSENLYRSILNLIKFRKTHRYLYKKYKKSESKLMQFLSGFGKRPSNAIGL